MNGPNGIIKFEDIPGMITPDLSERYV